MPAGVRASVCACVSMSVCVCGGGWGGVGGGGGGSLGVFSTDECIYSTVFVLALSLPFPPSLLNAMMLLLVTYNVLRGTVPYKSYYYYYYMHIYNRFFA